MMSEEKKGGCSCYDWKKEMEFGTFKYKAGSWNMKSGAGLLRRIYFCPMCGGNLEALEQ